MRAPPRRLGHHGPMSRTIPEPDLLVRGGTVVTAEGRRRADVLIQGGRVAAVGEGLPLPFGAEAIDAGGCFVMPGGVDPHTHMQLPTMGTVVADDFLSGTAAAAAGGTTTLLDFVGPDRGEPPLEALARWRGWAARSTIDYGFHMTVSWWGDGFRAQMAPLVADHGVTSFKFFTAYKGGLMLPDEDIIRGFLRLPRAGRAAPGPRRERRPHRPPAAEAALRRGDRPARTPALAAARVRGRGHLPRGDAGRGARRAALRGARLGGAGGRGHREGARSAGPASWARPCPTSWPSTPRCTRAPTSTSPPAT